MYFLTVVLHSHSRLKGSPDRDGQAKMFKYRKNLRVRDNKVFSYGEHVANIIPSERKVVPFRWYSITTSKHVNHVANVLGYTVEKVEKGGTK
jgi:hypothetical protein